MNILNILKDLYCSKEKIFTHISIFSLLGIMTIALNNVILSYSGNVYSNYLGFAPSNSYELILSLLISLILIMFFIGYGCNLIQYSFKSKDLPDLDLSSYSLFIKALPILIVWSVYFIFMLLLGLVLLPITSFLFYLYNSILLCFIPFIHIVFVLFVEKCDIKPEYLNPISLIRVMDKTLGSVIFFIIQVLVLLFVMYNIEYGIFSYSAKIRSEYVQLGVRVAGLCLGVYLFNILNYVYFKGLVQIAKDKILVVNK